MPFTRTTFCLFEGTNVWGIVSRADPKITLWFLDNTTSALIVAVRVVVSTCRICLGVRAVRHIFTSLVTPVALSAR